MLAIVETARIAVGTDVDDADIVGSPPALPATYPGADLGHGTGTRHLRHEFG